VERDGTVVTEGEISIVIFSTIDKTHFRGHSIGTSALCWMIYSEGGWRGTEQKLEKRKFRALSFPPSIRLLSMATV
jgi:hypothetical protein